MCLEPATSSACIIVLLPAELGLKSTQVAFILYVVVGVCYLRRIHNIMLSVSSVYSVK